MHVCRRLVGLLVGVCTAGALSSVPAVVSGAQSVVAPRPVARRSGHTPAPVMPLGPIAAADAGAIALRWGIRIDAMRLVSDGFILEFRYTVLDPSKAAPLSLRKLKPVLKDETSGAEVIVPEPPTTGALRSTFLPKAGRSYFMVFANPRRFVKPGNQVTITIGEFSVTGITVTTDTISKKPGIP